MIVHEGIVMRYQPRDTIFDASMKSGVVIEEPSREEAGMGMEPSGYSFMNYRDTTTYTFHPYSGAQPVPCRRPRGYCTTQAY